MDNNTIQPQRSLLAPLQRLQKRLSSEPLPTDQQPAITETLMQMLHACASKDDPPFLAPDIQLIRGQIPVKTALEVAAGHHNILLVGSPGAGRSLLARTLPSLLPPADHPYPFRMPSPEGGRTALFGDATHPGEVTLAHGGVLFLKDLDRFDPALLTPLAQIIETGVSSLAQDEGSARLPAHFLLVASILPCPCGFSSDPARACICSREEVDHYRQPFREFVRTCFPIEIEVPLLVSEILSVYPEEDLFSIQKRVQAARLLQERRYAQVAHLHLNGDLQAIQDVQQYCPMDSMAQNLLASALRQLQLSSLQMLRLQAVARTTADLDGLPIINGHALAFTIPYISRFIRTAVQPNSSKIYRA